MIHLYYYMSRDARQSWQHMNHPTYMFVLRFLQCQQSQKIESRKWFRIDQSNNMLIREIYNVMGSFQLHQWLDHFNILYESLSDTFKNQKTSPTSDGNKKKFEINNPSSWRRNFIAFNVCKFFIYLFIFLVLNCST